MYDFRDTNEYLTNKPIPAEAMQINEVYLENEIEGYRTLYVKGREALSPELETYEVGTKNGEIRKSKRYPARVITVGYQLISTDAEAFREAYNTLGSILNVNDAEIIFNDEPDKFFIGTPTLVDEVDPGKNSVTGEIEITCLDPLKYSITEYEATPLIDDPRSILIDYGGTYESFPVLEADFYKEEESESGEATELTGAGDCGYVAFFNENEKIIQIGDPAEEDGTESYEKSQTLINQTFEDTNAWGATESANWKANSGKVIPADAVQAGSLGMNVASFSVPANPKTTSATVLKNKRTSAGSPRFYYTVTLRASGRTSNAVNITATITASLGTDKNYFGRGLGLRGSLYCGGAWRSVTIKGTSAYWRGRSGHTVSMSFTVTGLSNTTSALTGIKFKVDRTDSLLENVAGRLSETACSNLPISTYVADVPETYYLGAANYGEGSGKYHGPSITRLIPEDAKGQTGATDFTLTYKQKMCIGSGSGDTIQLGGFQAHVISGSGSNRKIVTGIRILKNKAGKTASLIFYVNDKSVESVDIDLSYTNKYFGAASTAVRTSTITKTGDTVKFNIAGIEKTYKDSSIAEVVSTEVTFMLEQYSTVKALSWNGLYWIKFIKNNCDTWKNIPNKFSANDVLEADCNSGEIYLNGIRSPQLGALGNDWEGFYLKPGLNQIGVAYSGWVTDDYAPQFKVKYREAYL